MELIKNIHDGEFGIEGEVFFHRFDKYIGLIVEDDNLNYANRCATYLNELTDELIESLCEASIRYCSEFLKAIGEPTRTFKDSKEVLKMIYPSTLIIPYPEKGNDPVIDMELNCEWGEEHGMEWIVRGDEVLYVGAFSSEDPFSDFTDKETWNYA